MEDFKNNNVIKKSLYDKLFCKDKFNIIGGYEKDQELLDYIVNDLISELRTKDDIQIIKEGTTTFYDKSLRDLCDDVYALKRLQERGQYKAEKASLYYIDFYGCSEKMFDNVNLLYEKNIIQSLNIYLLFKTTNRSFVEDHLKNCITNYHIICSPKGICNYNTGIWYEFNEQIKKFKQEISTNILYNDEDNDELEYKKINLYNQPLGLIVGGPNSGKTNFLKSLIRKVLYKINEPKMVSILDPRITPDFDEFNNNKEVSIINNFNLTSELIWIQDEIHKRQKLIAEHRCRDIFEFNKHNKDKLRLIYIYIDEFYVCEAIYNKDEIIIIKKLINNIITSNISVGIHLYITTNKLASIFKENKNFFQFRCSLSSLSVEDVFDKDELMLINNNYDELDINLQDYYKCCLLKVNQNPIRKYYIKNEK